MHMLGRLMAFRGDDIYFDNDAAVIEVTEVKRDGRVEIAFDLPNRQRVYVTVKLQDLIAGALAECPNKES